MRECSNRKFSITSNFFEKLSIICCLLFVSYIFVLFSIFDLAGSTQTMPNLASIISSSYFQMPPSLWRASQLSCEVHISHEKILSGACSSPPPVPHSTCMGCFWGSAQAHPKQQSHHPAGGQVAEREEEGLFLPAVSQTDLDTIFFFCQADFLGIQTFNGNVAMLVKLQWESPSALR